MYMNVTTLAPPPGQFCDFAYFPVEVNLHHPIPAIRSIEMPNHNLNNNRLFLGGSHAL